MKDKFNKWIRNTVSNDGKLLQISILLLLLSFIAMCLLGLGTWGLLSTPDNHPIFILAGLSGVVLTGIDYFFIYVLNKELGSRGY